MSPENKKKERQETVILVMGIVAVITLIVVRILETAPAISG